MRIRPFLQSLLYFMQLNFVEWSDSRHSQLIVLNLLLTLVNTAENPYHSEGFSLLNITHFMVRPLSYLK